MSTIFVETTVRLTASFHGFDGLNLDPTTVTVRVKPPATAVVTSSYASPVLPWTHPETGVYAFDVVVDDAGTWLFSFDSSGTLDAYGEGQFLVSERSF